MTMDEFRKIRGMYFVKRGMKVIYEGRIGRVSSANSSCNLNITFDGMNYSQNCHPQWGMKYLDNKGNIIAEFDK